MAIKFFFNSKTIIEPGAYAQTKSGIPPRPIIGSVGKVMIIDTGSGATFGGGSGVSGELASGVNSVYGFDNITDFRKFIGGGLWWDVADYLFRPTNNTNATGVEEIIIVRAATTRAGNIIYGFSGGAGSGAKATAFLGLSAVTVTAGGSGYTNGVHTINIDGGVYGTVGTVDVTVAGGVVTTAVINTAGSYTVAPLGTYIPPSGDIPAGTGAKLSVDFEVASVTVNTGGTGYLVAPTVEFVGGGAPVIVATGTATLLADVVSTVAVGVGGSGYTYAPQVLFRVTTGNGGLLHIKTKTEGYIANGTLSGSLLTKGYAAKIVVGTRDTSKFKILFYRGTFKGLDTYGDPYDAIAADDTTAELLASSVEFVNIQDFINWAKKDTAFNTYFTLFSSTVYGTGDIDSDDQSNYSTYNLAVGGYETYTSADLDKVLDTIKEEDNTYFLTDQYGDDAQSVSNFKILTHIKEEAEFEKFLVIGGGYDIDHFSGTDSSLEIAAAYNSERVLVIHSGIKSQTFTGAKDLSSLYHAAISLGRIAGLPAQIPGTWKDLRILGLVHECTQEQREILLEGGVMHTRFIDGEWVINESINSLQEAFNTQLYNTDGTSFEHSIGRIKAQLNKELVLNARNARNDRNERAFIGGNQNTASEADIKAFVEGFLTRKTATKSADNLIIKFRDVKVKLNQDAWEITYGFYPNGPINKLFFTGIILDSNIIS